MITALILSGGNGSRLGSDIPKQYIKVGEIPIISYCIRTISQSNKIDGIWIVADSVWQENILEWLPESDCNKKFKGFSKPGANRQLSVYHGIIDIKNGLPDTDCVFIHDAARPLLSASDIDNCVNALEEHDGVIPVLPVKDTVYKSSNGKIITDLLPREQIVLGQAPELFLLDKYLSANEQLIYWTENNNSDEKNIDPDSPVFKINGSTEPAIMAGMDIAMIPGNEENYKITTASDLERFKTMVNGSKQI